MPQASPKPIEPFSNAHGSMWAATVLMALTLPFYPIATEPTLGVWTAVAALGVLCTGVAYLIYFRLIQDMGPISALSVTFLIPVFGILWGVLFLDEQIDWSTIIGALVVLVGTALTNGITPRFFLESGKIPGRIDLKNRHSQPRPVTALYPARGRGTTLLMNNILFHAV